jgi:hypothetical protein
MTVLDKGRPKERRAAARPQMTSVDFQIEPLERHGTQLACAITGSAVNGGVIELSDGSSHTMTFQLVPGNVSGLSFVPEASYPFCSVVDGCPKKGNQIPQFTNAVVSADGQTLTVTADAGTDPIVHYSLRFTDGGTTALTWDPIIINH